MGWYKLTDKRGWIHGILRGAHSKGKGKHQLQHQHALHILDLRTRDGPSYCGMWELIHVKSPSRWAPRLPRADTCIRVQRCNFRVGYMHPECPEGLAAPPNRTIPFVPVFLSSLNSCIRLGQSAKHRPSGVCPGANAGDIFSLQQDPGNISLGHNRADLVPPRPV
jgi:hypothetical protein